MNVRKIDTKTTDSFGIAAPQAPKAQKTLQNETVSISSDKGAKKEHRAQSALEHQDSENRLQNQTDDTYKDPLRNWPLKGCAYSNEIGAALGSLSPALEKVLWVPALMYFGADIYDKYKNDDTEYSPSKKRGLKEAVFQAAASVFLPTAAVKAGQKTASHLDRYTKTGLSSQAKEEILNSSLEYIKSAGLEAFENGAEPQICTKSAHDYAENFASTVQKKAKSAKNDFNAMPFYKKILSIINPLKDSDTLAHADMKKTGAFARQQGGKIISMYSDLIRGIKPKAMSAKMYEKFKNSRAAYNNNTSDAAKAILQEFHAKQLFQNKLLKTAGGFAALLIAIKPIDNFVEHFIIKKTVEPGLDFIEEKYPIYEEKIGSQWAAFKQKNWKK